jgi:uncharacterized RDD family membrane protein YckC
MNTTQQKNSYLKRRLLSVVVDFSSIVAYVLVLFGLTTLIYRFVLGATPVFDIFTAHLIGFVTLILPVLVYFIVSELGVSSNTLGKRIVGLKVASMDNKKLTIKQVIMRNIIKFLPWEYAHILVYILILVPKAADSQLLIIGLIIANIIPLVYLALIVFRKDHRGPHELVSRTIVVDK